MIVSHEHKFIFLKTKKTAGTSVEIALSKFGGPRDIITPIAPPEDEKMRTDLGYCGPQNFAVPFSKYTFEDWKQLVTTRQRVEHYNHEPAVLVRQRLPRETWDSYFKFTIERNPWDRALSFYHFRFHGVDPKPPLSEFLETVRPKALSQIDLYSLNGTVAVDRVIRYEKLDAELAEIGSQLGFPSSLELPRAKGQYRKDRTPYRELIGDKERERIAQICAREIALFGYEF